MYTLGLDIGSTSVKTVLIDSDKNIIFKRYELHRGKPQIKVKETLSEISRTYGTKIKYGAISAKEDDLFSNCPGVTSVNPIASLVEGALHLDPTIRSISEMGGQSSKYITNFSDEDRSNIEFSINENCSAGTGSFLEQQATRLNFDIEDYSTIAKSAKSIPRIAGRCSVFAKTDITHHQQEGTPIPDILKGLAYGVVKNYKSSVMKKLPYNTPVLFCGGVAQNETINEAFRDILNEEEPQIKVSEYSHVVSALGAALVAEKNKNNLDLKSLIEFTDRTPEILKKSTIQLPALKDFGQPQNRDLHICTDKKNVSCKNNCWLGVDVGSTSTNLVLIDEENKVVGYRYLRTAGDPVKAVTQGLKELEEDHGDRITIAGAGTTGSGRYLASRLIGADVVKDEITSQAKAATALDPEIDTIFEIGGQDSKYIYLQDGKVRDFQMNKVCAAGTGSFIEEQALKMGIAIENYGEIAFKGESPTDLGERCTVFMESKIATAISEGEPLENIASGLCYSIVNNYLNKVVGHRKIGNKIAFQGGLAWNPGVVNAFKAVTKKEINITPFFSVTGAYGVAMLTKENMSKDVISNFKGFHPVLEEKVEEKKVTTHREKTFTDNMNSFLFKDYDESKKEGAKTVGIPRALFTYGMFPMFYPFFKELGLNVVLSDKTSDKTIELAQSYSIGETCYPVKLINGHIADLIEKKVDYIFFPDLHTIHHPDSKSRQNYGCAYMQLAFKLVNQAMDLEKRGITLLAPTIAFNMGKEFMMNSFSKIGSLMGKTKEETMGALQKAMKSYEKFDEAMKEKMEETQRGLDHSKKTFVIISKIYGVADPVLNMGIPEKLAHMGYQVIPFYEMPEEEIFDEYPNMYWPFGQHILEAIKGVKKRENFYAVYLSHHGCGPDTATSQYIKEIMGGKPYLNIEIDEHASEVGIMTRVEAFVNSIESSKSKDERPAKTEEIIYIPNIYPYSNIASWIMKEENVKVEVLKTSPQSIQEGRKLGEGNDYYSMICLLGDIVTALKNSPDEKKNFIIPQNEGAEIDGQYSRIIESKLREIGINDSTVTSPYIEDLLGKDDSTFWKIFMTLLAGDLVLASPLEKRAERLLEVETMVKTKRLSLFNLKTLARQIGEEDNNGKKKILAVGEPLILFNNYLNGDLFKTMEKKGHQITYGSMTEAMWLFWKDLMEHKTPKSQSEIRHLEELEEGIALISAEMGDASPFTRDLFELKRQADDTVGLYAGCYGRYRESKSLATTQMTRGVIRASSMYENTGISLNSLHRHFKTDETQPSLDLTFDGTDNTSNREKIDSFLYYLK